MNSAFYSSVSILGVTALIIASSALSAQAEPTQLIPDTVSSEPSLQSNNPAWMLHVENSESLDNAASNEAVSASQLSGTTAQTVTDLPIPGSTITSAAALQVEEVDFASSKATIAESEAEAAVAQLINPDTPGLGIRPRINYVAVGGNIGFGDDTALGRGSFVVTSKIGLTDNFSARPGLVVNGDPTILLPITFDYPVRSAVDGRITLAPFVGGGIAISTDAGSEVRALAVGGVDIPITERFTATASANAAFFDNPEIGVILGVGYNF